MLTREAEPGYYEDGRFGIRIENVMVVVPTSTSYQFGGTQYLRLDNLTLVRPVLEPLLSAKRALTTWLQVPYDCNLIDVSLLENRHVAYIDAYHAECRRYVLDLCCSVWCG